MVEVQGVQECVGCRVVKPFSEFHVCRNRSSGFRSRCKPCTSLYMRGWHKTRPPPSAEKGRDKHLRQRYGLSHADYTTILQAQNSCCAICGTAEPGSGFNHFHVDHDHTTGRIRGLLCARCNQALGLFREDPRVITRAAAYLSQSSSPSGEVLTPVPHTGEQSRSGG